MSTIPVSLTEKQFDEHIRPYISTAKRGFESKIPLFKVFNYVLYRLQQAANGINFQSPQNRAIQTKRRSVTMLSTTIFANGAEMVAYEEYGNTVL